MQSRVFAIAFKTPPDGVHGVHGVIIHICL